MAKVKKHPHAGKQGRARDFIKVVHELAHSRNHAEVFTDFVDMTYFALAKTMASGKRADELEASYMSIVGKREADYVRRMPELLGITALALDGGQEGDFLGSVVGELGVLSSWAGQFFTPFEVSRLMAKITLGDVSEKIADKGFVTIVEPASGAGGMILAAASVLRGQGHDPLTSMWVEATDISSVCAHTTYVQMALSDIPGRVVHGDSIMLTAWSADFTPPAAAFVARHGSPWKDEAAPIVPAVRQAPQLDLFGAT